MKQNTKPYPSKPIPFLLHYAFKNKWLIFVALFFAFLEVAAEKLAPFYFSKITGLFIENADYNSIKTSLFLFLGLYVLMEFLTRVFYYFAKQAIEVKLTPKLSKDVASDMFYYLHGHSVEYFANNMAGKLADKVRGAAEISSKTLTDLMFYIKLIFNFVATVGIFASIDITFSSSYLGVIILAGFIFVRIGKCINAKRREMAQVKTEVSGKFIDAIQNIFFTKIFNAQKHEKNLWQQAQDKENKTYKSYTLISVLYGNTQFFFFNILNIAYLVYALFLWKEGAIKAQEVVFIFFLIRQASGLVEQILYLFVRFNSELAELESHLEPFAMDYDIKDLPNATKLKVKEGQIEFKDISFSYKEGKEVFNNFSLTIKPQEKIGIVGHSGCGKTTLVNLLQRLYDVDSGSILVDNKNTKKISQDSLRQNISYISQNSQLFDRSLKENIAYGKPKAKEKDIINAAKNAYAHDFITELDDGYNTVLKGTKKLSDGQLQRISIARALLEDAPILILDEATSSLDSQSEDYIQKSITKLIKGKTVIAIAHRLSTLKNMDRIIVIEDGKIIEDGKLKSLIAKGGKFAEFWNMQKLKEEKHGK